MATSRLGLTAVILVVTSSLWLQICSVQSQAPVYQNISIATIRLSSNLATDTNRGRVDIQVTSGAWGSICPKGWNASVTTNNVNTICLMLGFRNGGRRINATFGDGNKNFLIEAATCPSSAMSLSQCTQYFAKNCGPADEELAVECNADPQGVNIRLLLPVSAVPGTGGNPAVTPSINVTYLNGTATANCVPSSRARLYAGDLINSSVGNGYVQVNVGGNWGFVCGDSWNQLAAKIVCKELCYTTAGFDALPGVIAYSVPDPSNKVILFTSFTCQGNETSLLDCPVVNATAVCGSNVILAGVQCSPDYSAAKTVITPDVNCSSDLLVANFSRFPLITVNNVFMVNSVPSQCMNVTSGSSGVIATISVSSACGVDLRENSTHITYTVPIKYLWVSGSTTINSYTNMRYDVVCSVAKAYLVTNRFQPYTLAPNTSIYQQYNYSLSLDLYTNYNFSSLSTPVGSVFMLEVGQWLIAAVTINNYDNRTKLVLTDCDAYPVMPYAAYSPVVKLIQDKCPVDTTLTMYSLDNRRQGFQTKVFMFAGYSMVYIRCSVNVCLLDSIAPECNRACSKPATGRRRKRQASNEYRTSSVDTPTIFVYDPNDAGIAKILAASVQKTQDSNNGPDTSTTTAGGLVSSTIRTTVGQQSPSDQQSSVAVTRTPSSTTTKLGQLLQESSERSAIQTTPTPSTEATTATRSSQPTTTAAPQSTSTTAAPQSTTTTRVPESTTTTRVPESTTTTRVPESTTTTRVPQSTTSTESQEGQSTTVTTATTTSTRPSSSIQTSKLPGRTSTTQEAATSTAKRTSEINTAPQSTRQPKNEHDVSAEESKPLEDQGTDQADVEGSTKPLIMGQKGVASELTGDKPTSGASAYPLSSIAGASVFLYTLAFLL